MIKQHAVPGLLRNAQREAYARGDESLGFALDVAIEIMRRVDEGALTTGELKRAIVALVIRLVDNLIDDPVGCNVGVHGRVIHDLMMAFDALQLADDL